MWHGVFGFQLNVLKFFEVKLIDDLQWSVLDMYIRNHPRIRCTHLRSSAKGLRMRKHVNSPFSELIDDDEEVHLRIETLSSRRWKCLPSLTLRLQRLSIFGSVAVQVDVVLHHSGCNFCMQSQCVKLAFSHFVSVIIRGVYTQP